MALILSVSEVSKIVARLKSVALHCKINLLHIQCMGDCKCEANYS